MGRPDGARWDEYVRVNPTGTDAIAWDEISLATDTVIQHGLISSKGSGDPNLFFYSPSIAVNSTGEVVIGFSGSDQATFISSYAAVGTTNFGVTTFAMKLDPTTNVPVPLQAGKGVYTGEGLNAVPGELGPIPPPAPGVSPGGTPLTLWSGYSSTVFDPSNPTDFWTFQGFSDSQSPTDFSTWGVQATQIAVDQPIVTLTISGPPPATTPQELGVIGDSLSAGDVSGTTPGFVSQLTGSGEFRCPSEATRRSTRPRRPSFSPN